MTNLHQTEELAINYAYDLKKFEENFASNPPFNESQTKAYIIFFTHPIEKGLSFQEFRPNFGESTLKELSSYLNNYVEQGYSKEDIIFVNAISCLHAYVKKHETLSVELSPSFYELFTPFLDDIENTTIKIGGTTEVNKSDKTIQHRDFKDIITGRKSVRDYSDTPVDINQIKDAINLAVCNRQSARVKVIQNKETITKILSNHGGFSSSNYPKVLLVLQRTTITSLHQRNGINRTLTVEFLPCLCYFL